MGSGGFFQAGWIGTDKEILNLLKERDRKKLFKVNSVDCILAEHVWEHLTLEDGKAAFKRGFKYLKKGGRFRIAIQDGFHPDIDYINYVKPGGYGAGADDHKVLYSYKSLS